MYDDERVIRSLLEAFLVFVVGNRLLSQPLIEGSDDSMSHGIFFQNMIDFGLRCAEQDLAFGEIEKR